MGNVTGIITATLSVLLLAGAPTRAQPMETCERREDYQWRALSAAEIDQLHPFGLGKQAGPVAIPRGAQGVELRQGLVSFDVRGEVHTGDFSTDRMLRAHVTHEFDQADFKMFHTVAARQAYVRDDPTWRPVSVAGVMADILALPTGQVSERLKRALLKRARDTDLPAYLGKLGMPNEAKEVALLLVSAGRIDNLTEPQLKRLGEAWAGRPATGELEDMAVVYHLTSDGPVQGVGRSWSLAWQVKLDQLTPAVRAAVLTRLLPGRPEGGDRHYDGIYEQQLLGSNYYMESLATYEMPRVGAKPTAWHYSLIVDLADAYGVQFADRQLERVWELAAQVDGHIHQLGQETRP